MEFIHAVRCFHKFPSNTHAGSVHIRISLVRLDHSFPVIGYTTDLYRQSFLSIVSCVPCSCSGIYTDQCLYWARFPPLSRVWSTFLPEKRRLSSGEERRLLSRTAAGNRAYVCMGVSESAMLLAKYNNKVPTNSEVESRAAYRIRKKSSPLLLYFRRKSKG